MPNVSLLTSGIGDVNQGGSLVPTGTVFAFAGATAPAGWLLCDGTAYNQADYASLFSVIGSLYNTQTNPTTNAAWATPSAGQFRVPDYRGVFLRSSGQPSGLDNVTVGGHQGQTTAKNGISAVSASAGSHSHTLGRFTNWGNGTSGNTWGAGWSQDNGGNLGVNSYPTDSQGSHSHTVTVTGDSETRPVNKGVLYIIKV
jgi:microcystin-dependent protein